MYISLKNVSKRIKGVTVLDHISFEFQEGKIYGFQGKNGCGKTMLMRAICGLITLDEGTVEIDGKILHKDISFPKSIGILLENPSFLDGFTGLDNLKLLADISGGLEEDELKLCLEKVGLEPEDKKVYRKYSLGMKQKLGIAAAIMGTPKIVILDEPINAIDEKGVSNVRMILDELKDKKTIVIVACHDREELELLSDEIIQMEEGRLLL